MPRIHRAEQESSVQSTEKRIDVSDEQSIFCPFCKGTNVELVDEATFKFLYSVAGWLCKDCDKYFSVETRQFITYEEQV